MNCLDRKIPRNKSLFLTYMTAHDDRHVNTTSRKSLEIHKTKNPFEAKICMKISFQLL